VAAGGIPTPRFSYSGIQGIGKRKGSISLQINKEKQRLIIIGAGLLLIILALVIVVVVAVGGSGDNNSEDGEYVPSNMQYIEDIYEGHYMIPKYDVSTSALDLDQFTAQGGSITYPGAKVGIDVSDHQKEIDWAQVKTAGVDFAIIRVGYRGYTEGGLFLDNNFEANIKSALENEIAVGVYFFSQAITTAEAEQEAQYVMDLIANYDITYPVVYDWEPITNYTEDAPPRTTDCTAEDINAFTLAFCKKVKESGYIPAFYSNKSMGYKTYDLEALDEFDFWYAEYQPKPSFYYAFDIWQYTDAGKVNGIETAVDINLCFKNYGQ